MIAALMFSTTAAGTQTSSPFDKIRSMLTHLSIRMQELSTPLSLLIVALAIVRDGIDDRSSELIRFNCAPLSIRAMNSLDLL